MGRGEHGTMKPAPSMVDVGVKEFGGKSHAVSWKPTPGKRQITWQEVAQHNTAESAWVALNQNVYDITSWLDKHPGGRAYLLLAAGRDITDLFTTYHPFTDKPHEVIAKYEIGELSNLEFPQYKPDTGFYKETRAEVGKYFKETGLNPKDPAPGLIRLAGMLFIAALCYIICVVGDHGFSFPIRMLAAIVFGVCQALPLLHCMHDASHTSIGNNETWWLGIGKFCMDWFAGASLVSWHNQHIIGHHVYTNVIGADPDLPVKPTGDIRRVMTRQTWLPVYHNQHIIGHHVYTNVIGADPDLPVKPTGDIRRVMTRQTWLPVYQFQHIYLLVLYGLLAIKFRIQDVTDTFLDRSNGSIRVNPHSTLDICLQIVTKCLFFFWRIYLPLFYFHVPALEFALLFLLSEFTTGYYLTFNFQVSHVSPTSDWPVIDLGFNDEWAVSQLKTTVDYGHGSFLTTFLCGALNYQSVHHLFPSVSQYHYPALAPIIMRVAKKHNVPYFTVPSFYQAFLLHIKHLQEMGKAKEE